MEHKKLVCYLCPLTTFTFPFGATQELPMKTTEYIAPTFSAFVFYQLESHYPCKLLSKPHTLKGHFSALFLKEACLLI